MKISSNEFDGSDIIPSYFAVLLKKVIFGPTLDLSAIPLRSTTQSVIAFKFSVNFKWLIFELMTLFASWNSIIEIEKW